MGGGIGTPERSAEYLTGSWALAYGYRGIAYNTKAKGLAVGSEERKRYLDQALADHTKLIALDPSASASWGQRGVDYLDLGDNEKAIADFRHALALNPQASSRELLIGQLKDLGVDAQ